MSDIVLFYTDKDVEKGSTKPMVRHFIFPFATVFFIVIIMLSIYDIYYKKALLESNLTYFIISMIGFGLIFTTIILNVYRYNQITTTIKDFNEKNKLLYNIPHEKFVYTKTLWVYPLVAFIYFIILIIFFIIINHKCAILKNTLSNFV
jgi:hypothetical protein